MKLHFVTRAEYEMMTPYTQGYTWYWEGEQPGSELRGLTNPYAEGTAECAEWRRGASQAALDAQDGEE